MLARSTAMLLAALAAFATLGAASSDAEAGRYVRVRPARPHGHVHVALYPRGLYVGGGLVATRILGQSGGDELLEDGFGLTLFTGIRVNNALALELGYLGTLHNPQKVQTTWGNDVDYLMLNGVTADAKIYVGGNRNDSAAAMQPNGQPASTGGGTKVQPFVQGGVGLYVLDSTLFGTESVGTGFQLGGGMDIELGSHLDLGVRALYRGIAMGPPERVENDTFVSAVTVEANLGLRF
jgi:hypothetical protein